MRINVSGDTRDARLVKRKLDFFKAKLSDWSTGNTRDFPWRKTVDPYQVCVAEIMLHQTFARKVAPVYEGFVRRYPDVKSLSKAKVGILEKIIYPLGFLYRAGRLKEMARVVVKEHGGRMPSDKNSLLSLPGIGEYTASAVMCFAYGEQTPIIDTNVVRLYTRFFGLAGKLPSSSPTAEIRQLVSRALPKGKARQFNYAVLDFAASLCKHYSPECSNCPLARRCSYYMISGSSI